MALLKARLHLPFRAPDESRPVPAPIDRADRPPLVAIAGEEDRRPSSGVEPVAAAAREPTAVDERSGIEAPAHPAPLRPEPVRRTHAAPRSPRRQAAPPDPAQLEQSVLADEPSQAAEVEPERPLRLVLVEEVPEVAAHVREMLRAQPSLRIVEILRDGRGATREVRDLRADVVLVDVLLQGRVPGTDVIERIRAEMPGMPIVALATPGAADLVERVRSHVDSVVTMPFGTVDLARGIHDAHDGRASRDPAGGTRVVAVYAAKGGVGKTTLALNLAVALAASGTRTALVDGSLQYGDLRRLLHVDPSEPSICDLPTDCVRASDLVGAMRAGPAGVDILFAPPRLEMADMVTARDLDKILDLLRRSYRAVVVDTPSALNDTTLAVLDIADIILQVLTPEPAALDSTRAAAAAFAAIGYPAAKVRTVINRVDAQGGLRPDQLRRALGHEPDHTIASDWQLVASSNQEGVPFVVARPDARVSCDVAALAASVVAVVGDVPPRLPTRARSRAVRATRLATR